MSIIILPSHMSKTRTTRIAVPPTCPAGSTRRAPGTSGAARASRSSTSRTASRESRGGRQTPAHAGRLHVAGAAARRAQRRRRHRRRHRRPAAAGFGTGRHRRPGGGWSDVRAAVDAYPAAACPPSRPGAPAAATERVGVAGEVQPEVRGPPLHAACPGRSPFGQRFRATTTRWCGSRSPDSCVTTTSRAISPTMSLTAAKPSTCPGGGPTISPCRPSRPRRRCRPGAARGRPPPEPRAGRGDGAAHRP